MGNRRMLSHAPDPPRVRRRRQRVIAENRDPIGRAQLAGQAMGLPFAGVDAARHPAETNAAVPPKFSSGESSRGHLAPWMNVKTDATKVSTATFRPCAAARRLRRNSLLVRGSLTKSMTMSQRTLLSVVLLLTLGVITLGSYVRLSNAGLGCPDWPGCYGRLMVPADLRAAGAEAHARAWIEMVHRYAAGFLGVCIAALTVLAWHHRHRRMIAAAAAALVVFQALLGMWTVTLRLQPLIVMGHLLGGLGLLSLLWLWRLADTAPRPLPRLRPYAVAALLAVVLQIALGGWTSANYAAIACPDLPTCQGAWWPDMDVAEGFSLPAAVNGSWEGGGHTGEGRTAIHLVHRLGALTTLLVVGVFAAALVRAGGALRVMGVALATVLLLQFSLGLGNVLLGLPLPMAVAHTTGAALLLLTVLWSARAVIVHRPVHARARDADFFAYPAGDPET